MYVWSGSICLDIFGKYGKIEKYGEAVAAVRTRTISKLVGPSHDVGIVQAASRKIFRKGLAQSKFSVASLNDVYPLEALLEIEAA